MHTMPMPVFLITTIFCGDRMSEILEPAVVSVQDTNDVTVSWTLTAGSAVTSCANMLFTNTLRSACYSIRALVHVG